MFSFIDGFIGYNQIRMTPEDEEKMAFYTLIGVFRYTVMPFCLKNVGATYQRAMQSIFADMIHEELEDYIDDIIFKSKTCLEYMTSLQCVVQCCREYNLTLNPHKCPFGASSGQFLGFIVHERGIKIDPAKIQAIRAMALLTSFKQLKNFLGMVNYIWQFIPNLSTKILPLTQAPKKSEGFV